MLDTYKGKLFLVLNPESLLTTNKRNKSKKIYNPPKMTSAGVFRVSGTINIDGIDPWEYYVSWIRNAPHGKVFVLALGEPTNAVYGLQGDSIRVIPVLLGNNRIVYAYENTLLETDLL